MRTPDLTLPPGAWAESGPRSLASSSPSGYGGGQLSLSTLLLPEWDILHRDTMDMCLAPPGHTWAQAPPQALPVETQPGGCSPWLGMEGPTGGRQGEMPAGAPPQKDPLRAWGQWCPQASASPRGLEPLWAAGHGGQVGSGSL